MSNFYIINVIIVVALVTIGLRIAPFILMDKLTNNTYLRYIGRKMPVGVMILLVLYTFLHIDFSISPYGLPYILAALVVILIYGYFKNILLAIVGGLFIHLILVNFIF
ncbi:AzlD domain-containing protein [Acinetobacter populi]|uniref:Branched-chain amino acid transporter n=1 Tax=Acinetobacter populi TaxID=1582270 RepID=A0A1Z9Z1V5_9GAMM|nr:AzlD domain-containing protein [Acinetobacter populi]OUY08444.1 branched-chain amino acid transporter [Acinetobacter populi]